MLKFQNKVRHIDSLNEATYLCPKDTRIGTEIRGSNAACLSAKTTWHTYFLPGAWVWDFLSWKWQLLVLEVSSGSNLCLMMGKNQNPPHSRARIQSESWLQGRIDRHPGKSPRVADTGHALLQISAVSQIPQQRWAWEKSVRSYEQDESINGRTASRKRIGFEY